jgi:hypothetical protein
MRLDVTRQRAWTNKTNKKNQQKKPTKKPTKKTKEHGPYACVGTA